MDGDGRILEMAATGMPYAKMAEKLGTSFWRIYKACRRHGVDRRRRLSEERQQAIISDIIAGANRSAIAASYGIHKSTVTRLASRDLEREATTAETLEVEFVHLSRARRCPHCGSAVVTSPCVSCLSRGKMQ
jgi:hypothetical protein